MSQEPRPRKKPRRWWVIALLVGAVFVGVLAILGRGGGVGKPDWMTGAILVLMVAFFLYKIQNDPTIQQWPQDNPDRGKPSARWWAVVLSIGLVFGGIVAAVGIAQEPGAKGWMTGIVIGGVVMLGFVWLAHKFWKIMPTPEQSSMPPEVAVFEEAKARGLQPAKMPRKGWVWLGLWLAAALVPAMVIGVGKTAAELAGGASFWGALGDGIGTALALFFFFAVALIFAITPYMKTTRELLGDAFVPAGMPVNDASFPAPDAALAPILDELEAARKQAWLQANPFRRPRPTRWLLGGAVLGFLVFLIAPYQPGVTITLLHKIVNMVLLPLVGAGLAAFMWGIGGRAKTIMAQADLDAAYGQLYKQRVLPRLAASFGHLAWRGVARPPLDEFKRYRLFPDWDAARAENEIYGDYRGLPLSICELKLSVRQGNLPAPVFAGLAVTLTLPRALSGITVVTAAQESVFGPLLQSLRAGAAQTLQPVHLEDPVFAKAFQVHATDQVASRALLTPAFMERFKSLMNSFGEPALLAQDNRLFMALAADERNLFQPPSYNESAAARAKLAQLRDDIATLLRVADAVIDLDQSARQAARLGAWVDGQGR